MNNQITPGPWTTVGDGKTVLRHHHDGTFIIAEHCKTADAKLIAAAPELLILAHELLEELQASREEIYFSETVGGNPATMNEAACAFIKKMDSRIYDVKRIIRNALGKASR